MAACILKFEKYIYTTDSSVEHRNNLILWQLRKLS